ncbi:MAG TPA: hypothetical protein VGB48_02385, partial [Allosphingosinicella sp.]
MAELVRLFDWSATPLGPMSGWPASLRFAADLCLRSALPSVLYLGENRLLLPNDAWAHSVGGEGLLGLPAEAARAPLWPVVRGLAEEVARSGEGGFAREQPLTLIRDGVAEESWWNCHLIPVHDDEGRLLAILNQANDVSRTVLAERRLSFQVALADALRGAEDAEAVKNGATRLLGEYLGTARVGYAEVDEAKG